MASQLDAQLFAALERAAVRRLGDFKGQGLANTAWAFVTASQSDAQLFVTLARVPPFSVAWATSTQSKSASPTLVGHIFQSFFKIGFQRILCLFWQVFGFPNGIFFEIFPHHVLASLLDQFFFGVLMILDSSKP